MGSRHEEYWDVGRIIKEVITPMTSECIEYSFKKYTCYLISVHWLCALCLSQWAYVINLRKISHCGKQSCGVWGCLLSHIWFFASPWTLARQTPLSMGFPREEYWSGSPFPSPGDLLHPGIEPASPVSPALAGDFFTTEPLGKPRKQPCHPVMCYVLDYTFKLYLNDLKTFFIFYSC